jgi:hypothetical protein
MTFVILHSKLYQVTEVCFNPLKAEFNEITFKDSVRIA